MQEETQEKNNELIEESPQESGGMFVPVIVVFILLAIIGGAVTYFFNVQKKVEQELAAKNGIPEEKKINEELAKVYEQRIGSLMKKVEEQQVEIKRLSQLLADSKNTTAQVANIPKPKSILVAECTDMEVGKWNISTECKSNLIAGINQNIQNQKNIIAWEVIPIVDEKPYAGSSPELKQEGLASYRTRDAHALLENIDKEDSPVFKGLTLQQKEQRGFKLKAYYIPQS